MINQIICSDSIEALKHMKDEIVNCVMTSPPYWALRDYGVSEQIGLEPTFDEYITKLCDIFDEVKRVLRKDGTCWVNLGDTYWGGGHGGNTKYEVNGKMVKDKKYGIGSNFVPTKKWDKTLTSKTLTMIPFRFAIEMVNRGWILRNVIIWHKPNCMPSSAKDRFTVDFEYLFFFVKSKKYWFEQQFEELDRPELANKTRNVHAKKWDKDTMENMDYERRKKVPYSNPQGRNKRTVWRICPRPYKEAHRTSHATATAQNTRDLMGRIVNKKIK